MRIVVLGIDLGKNLCSLAGLDETGAVILRRRMKRAPTRPPYEAFQLGVRFR
jgi:predicted NBD/HSP70 family sugar kinase